ncbi:Polysulphide reductase NrfD [Arcobacter nitrofigilis DSM 7299]|uniref:Polysulphide reductase NrfD n=1 Tax=Arcobacter nitrofigilis (strain ATCC 33309 / DSM 7299 / CCUG 15893 / LMG 7604 / NCTC 12251 / CI) TaxID=572480 RepID=D5V047_ARCNC|nr:NrfD/PsrC family molybdoenzyme membrane anchor subunit [Arcobacter nitrofigilis]ADG93659.1 Polysulphide reductase NrfD [Arcobacter nitrofigilis DSM 7299]
MDNAQHFLTLISSITIEKPWGIDIPNYFWFTGSSAAAFIISSFAHVFGWKKYKPIAGISLLMAFVLLVAAPLNLLDDLRQPGRVLNFFLYGWEDFPTSPMKWGVLLLMAYPILIFFEAQAMYRAYFVKKANESKGLSRFFNKLFTFGNMSLSEESLEKDHKKGFILGAIGIPLALCVHGYTGYILGAVHANVMWHTPLMPIIFLASAMVSGTGLLVILIPLFQRFLSERKKVDTDMVATLARLLSWFIISDLVMRFLWLTFSLTFANGEKYALYSYFSIHFEDTLWIDYVLCLFVPLIIGFTRLRYIPAVVYFGGIVTAIGVWIFRWNTVIGGQEIPRTTPGFLHYTPPMFGQDSVITVLSNWGILFALICAVLLIFPWDEEMKDCYEGAEDAK